MGKRRGSEPVHILMVEDNEADVRLTREALKGSRVHLHVVKDGLQALAFLRRADVYADAPRPHLVLLDLHLPGKDGREVLAEIKTDRTLHHIPVIVLSSSSLEQDILDSYELHANAYIVKPIGLEPFFTVIQAIRQFWLTVAEPPMSLWQ